MNKTKLLALIFVALFMAAFLACCSVVQQGADILTASGKISESDRQAIVKTSEAVRSTFADITEIEEYYIGRSVAALILSRYKVYDDQALTLYVNTVGQTVVYSSDRPEIYAGYHFLILDTDEVNALSAPGGLIFVSKGLVLRCRNEEMLASVLAHEVGHISARHGLQSIQKSRLLDAFRLIGREAARRYGPEELSQLTNIFEGALGDIVNTLILNGYDRKFEYEADTLAAKTTSAAGYAPQGLVDFLQTMVGDASAVSGKGWFKTHPRPEQRIERAKPQVASYGANLGDEPVRTKRFQQTVAGLK
jgi:beta-barrel assembly-enhancing protease